MSLGRQPPRDVAPCVVAVTVTQSLTNRVDMSLALVDHEGRVLDLDKKTPNPSQVEVSEEPLYLIAERQHKKDSTKTDTNNKS